jgi:hypothetical protein
VASSVAPLGRLHLKTDGGSKAELRSDACCHRSQRIIGLPLKKRRNPRKPSPKPSTKPVADDPAQLECRQLLERLSATTQRLRGDLSSFAHLCRELVDGDGGNFNQPLSKLPPRIAGILGPHYARLNSSAGSLDDLFRRTVEGSNDSNKLAWESLLWQRANGAVHAIRNDLILILAAVSRHQYTTLADGRLRQGLAQSLDGLARLGIHGRVQAEPVRPSSGESIADGWPPDDKWHFRPGQYAYKGSVFELSGRHWQILKVFAEATFPVPEKTLRSEIWDDISAAAGGVDERTIASTLTHLRRVLRKHWKLPASFNPIPAKDSGKQLCWRVQLNCPEGE